MKDERFRGPAMRSLPRVLVLLALAVLTGCGGSDQGDASGSVEEADRGGESAEQQESYHQVTRKGFESIKLGEGLEHVEEIMGGPGKDTLGRGTSFRFMSAPNAHGSQERVSVYLAEAGGAVEKVKYKYEFNLGNESAVRERDGQTLENIEVDLEAIREARTLAAINENTSVGYRRAERELHDNGTRSSIYAFGQGRMGDRNAGYAMVFYLTDGRMRDAVSNSPVVD